MIKNKWPLSAKIVSWTLGVLAFFINTNYFTYSVHEECDYSKYKDVIIIDQKIIENYITLNTISNNQNIAITKYNYIDYFKLHNDWMEIADETLPLLKERNKLLEEIK